MKEYPKNQDGNRFNHKWYSDYVWLEYSKSENAAFCFVCRYFGQNSGSCDKTYTKEGRGLINISHRLNYLFLYNFFLLKRFQKLSKRPKTI